MKKVFIRAPLLTYSGYGTHSRQIFRWLLSKKNLQITTGIVPWGLTPWMINPDIENGLVGEIMARSTMNPVEGTDISIQLQLPNEWDSNIAKTNIGMSAVVETDVCNPQWIDSCNKMDHVVVPSEHARTCLMNTGNIQTRLDVVPEGFYHNINDHDPELLNLDINTKFNFLIFGQITGTNPHNDRKNLFNTIKWICETFKDDPDVGIVIKTNSGRNTKIDKRMTTNLMRKLLEEVRPGPYPKVHLIHGALEPQEIGAIYRHPQIKALVSLTRGEGFGLPILEAAACGLPIIATNWSGHLDFMKLGKFIPVNYMLKEIDASRVDKSIFMKEAKWAEPIEDDAKKKLKKFRHNPRKPKEWAVELKDKILPKYNQDKLNDLYDEVLGRYLD